MKDGWYSSGKLANVHYYRGGIGICYKRYALSPTAFREPDQAIGHAPDRARILSRCACCWNVLTGRPERSRSQ